MKLKSDEPTAKNGNVLREQEKCSVIMYLNKNEKAWDMLWHVVVQAKIRYFLWRLAHITLSRLKM